jgi:hypothetical protein
MVRPPTAELHARFEHELARKLGDLNALDVQQVLRAYILLEHVPSGQVHALLDARVRELNRALLGDKSRSR